MAMKKKTIRRKVTQLKRASRPAGVQDRIRKTWEDAVAGVTDAEARVEKEIRGVLKRNKISTRNAATMLKDLRTLVGRERKKGMAELEARFTALQTRLRKERKTLARTVDEAVQGTLATFNIPSRQEVHELTRKVNDLSRKIDSFKR